MHKSKNKSGFTLVELAVVLVIVGLLVGGVLTGKELIEQAKQRSLIAQMNEYRTAMLTFKLKYGKLPGDFNNAVSFFGATANGNGDGVVNSHHSVGTPYEYMGVFEHLSKAQLLKGKSSYTWTTLSGVVGETIPETSYNKIGILFIGTRPVPTTWFSYLNNGKNHIQIGSVIDVGCCSDFLWGSGLDAIQSYSIDSKVDDGKPYTGKFKSTHFCTNDLSGYGYSNVNPNCTCVNTTTSEYLLNNENTGCVNYMELDL